MRAGVPLASNENPLRLASRVPPLAVCQVPSSPNVNSKSPTLMTFPAQVQLTTTQSPTREPGLIDLSLRAGAPIARATTRKYACMSPPAQSFAFTRLNTYRVHCAPTGDANSVGRSAFGQPTLRVNVSPSIL